MSTGLHERKYRLHCNEAEKVCLWEQWSELWKEEQHKEFKYMLDIQTETRVSRTLRCLGSHLASAVCLGLTVFNSHSTLEILHGPLFRYLHTHAQNQ